MMIAMPGLVLILATVAGRWASVEGRSLSAGGMRSVMGGVIPGMGRVRVGIVTDRSKGGSVVVRRT